MSKPTLKVWCLSDGRPGHFNQSKGLLQALEHGYQLELSWIDCTLQAKPLRPLLRTLLNAGHGHSLVKQLHSFAQPEGTPDLIVSTGGNTAYLNISLARLFGCQNYFIGSLRGLKPALFSKVFTIEPIGSPNNVVMPLAPVPTDRQAQAEAARTLRTELAIAPEQQLWTLLIGGANDQYRFTDNDWQALAAQLTQLARIHNIRWLITTSRRTGVNVEQQLATALPSDIIADATWYGQQPRKVMSPYLGAAEQIFCTEDSLSMLTEGIASGKPVTAIQPTQMTPEVRYEAALVRLTERGWLQRQPAHQLSVPDVCAEPPIPPAEDLWQRLQKA